MYPRHFITTEVGRINYQSINYRSRFNNFIFIFNPFCPLN